MTTSSDKSRCQPHVGGRSQFMASLGRAKLFTLPF